MKLSSKKGKFIVVVITIILTLLIFALGIWLLIPEKKPQSSGAEYYPANYDENIFLNGAYMSFQRDLLYSIGGVEQLFSFEKDYETATPECQFFLDYFHTVINGNYKEYKDFFVDGYFEEEPMFTMQMLYDLSARYHSVSKDEIDGEEVTLVNFQVGYKIFKNNKTYRSDVSSNTEVPQIYQLIKGEDGSYRIFRILNIEVKE